MNELLTWDRESAEVQKKSDVERPNKMKMKLVWRTNGFLNDLGKENERRIKG